MQPNHHAVPWTPQQHQQHQCQQQSPVPTTTVLVPTQAQDGTIVYMPMLLPIAGVPTSAATSTAGNAPQHHHSAGQRHHLPPAYWSCTPHTPQPQQAEQGAHQSPAVLGSSGSNSVTPTTTRRVKASKQHLVKSKLCRHFMRAVGCRNGPSCPFAHGEHELNQPLNRQPTPSSLSQASSQDVASTTAPLLADADATAEDKPLQYGDVAIRAVTTATTTCCRGDENATGGTGSRPVTAEPIAFMSPASHHGAIAPTPLSQADDESGYNGGLTVLQLPSLDDFAAMAFNGPPNDSAIGGTLLPDAVAASILTGVDQF